MKVSTRGRYALRVMVDLAEHWEGTLIPMKDIAARQHISLKYIERILPPLTRAGLIKGVHGKGGGYQLTREPEEYTALEILELTEGDIAPVACLKKNAPLCEREDICRTKKFWTGMHNVLLEYFGSVTLRDMMEEPEHIDNLTGKKFLC